MPTTVTKTIGTGGGRDYSTLQSWEDDAPANLVTSDQVWRGECYNDSEFTDALVVSGSTVDSTRYKELTTATGQSFADDADKLTNALRYDQGNGVGLNVSDSYTDAITVSEDYFRMTGLQVTRNTGGGGSRAWYDAGVTGAMATRCIFECDRTGAVARVEAGSMRSCLFVGRASSIGSIVTVAASGGSLINCTLVVPSDLTAATKGIARSYASSWNIINCAIFGVSDVGDTSGITYTNCYTNDATSLPSGVTNLAYNTSTGSGFENITDATRDFRIKSTSGLIDVGTTDSSGSPDIVGTTRPQGSAYDVGCWEFSSGGGGGSTPKGPFGLALHGPFGRVFG